MHIFIQLDNSVACVPMAIALCFVFPEDQFGAIVIAQTSTELTSAQAVFARSVVVEQIQSRPPDQRQVFRCMIFPSPVVIFPELNVQHPVLAVFDAPMLAHTLGKPFQVGE